MDSIDTIFIIAVASFGIISFVLGLMNSKIITTVKRGREVTDIVKFTKSKRLQYMVTGICTIVYSILFIIITNHESIAFTTGIIAILIAFEIFEADSRKYTKVISKN